MKPSNPRFLSLLISTFCAGIFLLSGAADDKKEQKSERYEFSIAAFEARDRRTPPPAHPLLFVGSSSIRMWDLEKSWPGYGAVNNGFGGSTLADSIHFFQRHIAPYKAKAILIYAGDNDMARGLDAAGVLVDFIKLTNLIESNAPDTPVIYIAIKPSIARAKLWPVMESANGKIRAFCAEKRNLYFADIATPMLSTKDGKPDPNVFKSDGLHLNETGYELWKAVILPILKKIGIAAPASQLEN